MAEAERGRGRILLALDTGTPLGPALEAAAVLAASLQAELAALFVEDERLLRLAALPFAREIGFASATLQSFGLAEMERALRVQAEQVRRALDDQARRLALAWTLDVMRGEVLAAALERLGPDDVLVLARSRHGRLPFDARSREAPRARGGGPVTVLCDGSEGAGRALGIGLALARGSHTTLVALVPAPGMAAFREQRSAIRQWLTERGGTAHSVRLPDGDGPAIARAVRELKASALVWPGAGAASAPGPLAQVLDDIACPIVLTPLDGGQ